MGTIVSLRAAGVGLVLDVEGPLVPRVLHWGADLGDLTDADAAALALTAGQAATHSGFDDPLPLTLVPVEEQGWAGSPGLAGHRAGTATTPRLRLTAPVRVGADAVDVQARDEVAGLAVTLALRLDAHGVLRVAAEVAAADGAPYDLAALRVLVPIPARAAEVLDLSGTWRRERSPQRAPLRDGTHLRASRRGRTGHDAALVLVAGTPGFGFRSGEVWGAHVAWSGDHEHLVERLPEGAGAHAAVLGGGELLRPGEIRLTAGERHRTPDVVLVWSGRGLDGLSDRLHASLRSRPRHPRGPRPILINTWEAVFFDHDLDRLRRLADTAAAIGVERFVLDDGWFSGRLDDRRGLGDWTVDGRRWPQGLHPLADHVRALGMEFGLWVEPEMVNVDSDLVRAHPDWVLAPRQGLQHPWRSQHVLDLTRAEVWDHALKGLDELVAEYDLDYLKWDHNRDLHEAVSRGPAGDTPAVHRQTLAVYALLDALRERHPRLEIETCASGGARLDLGILARTDRVWASDTNDALERQLIQRWTGLLVPPELVGTHVGRPVAHTTGRAVDLSFRLVTALFGWAGIEWDITTCTPEELDRLRAWTALHRELRHLLHAGRTVRADLPADDHLLHGVVAAGGEEAVYAHVALRTGPAVQPGRVPLPGLDPSRRYRVRVRDEPGPPVTVQVADPAWLAAAREEGVVLPGAVLGATGLTLPILAPANALLLHLTAA